MDDLQKKYKTTIDSWLKNNKSIDGPLQTILKRGLWLCLDNPENGLLLTGINPSYDAKYAIVDNSQFCKCSGDYWDRWIDNLQFYISKNRAGYLDLFPLRVSKQEAEFERFVPLELKAAILRVTQFEIERLQPQLIIHANKASSFYFGTSTKHPWMGYDLEQVAIPLELKRKGGLLYEIKRLQNNADRINYSNLNKTNLKYLFVCPYQNCIHLTIHPEKKMNAEDVGLLCNYLNIKI